LDEETAFLEPDGAFGEPGMADHFGDEFALHVIDRFFGFHEAAKEVVIFGLVFAQEDLEAAAEAVLDRVERDFFLRLLGTRSRALLSVGTIRGEFTARD
jgi:hypothetical protein